MNNSRRIRPISLLCWWSNTWDPPLLRFFRGSICGWGGCKFCPRVLLPPLITPEPSKNLRTCVALYWLFLWVVWIGWVSPLLGFHCFAFIVQMLSLYVGSAVLEPQRQSALYRVCKISVLILLSFSHFLGYSLSKFLRCSPAQLHYFIIPYIFQLDSQLLKIVGNNSTTPT